MEPNKNQNSPENKLKKAAKSMRKAMTDPQGMYTGVPADPYEEPIQDADDL